MTDNFLYGIWYFKQQTAFLVNNIITIILHNVRSRPTMDSLHSKSLLKSELNGIARAVFFSKLAGHDLMYTTTKSLKQG